MDALSRVLYPELPSLRPLLPCGGWKVFSRSSQQSGDRKTMAGQLEGYFCVGMLVGGNGVIDDLHRLGRHFCGCVVWVDVVGEGGEAVVGRVGGVFGKESGGVCRDGKCWEGHGVGEWQRILVGTLFALDAAFRKQQNVQTQQRRIRFALQTMNGARGSASFKGRQLMMMFDDVDGILYNPHLSNPQSICHHG